MLANSMRYYCMASFVNCDRMSFGLLCQISAHFAFQCRPNEAVQSVKDATREKLSTGMTGDL